MTKPFPFGRAGLLAVAALALLSVSCASDLTRTGRSSAYLIVDSLEAAPGAKPGDLGNPLLSDVFTLVDQTIDSKTVKVGTIFNDVAEASLRAAMKNPVSPTSPTEVSDITLTRYHVAFRRTDGRNTPGVDVPYGFDAGLTFTVAVGKPAKVGFEIVRSAMKLEPPLRNLREGGGANLIGTIAEVTFYGRDQAGNEVSVTGMIAVNFGDFADPK